MILHPTKTGVKEVTNECNAVRHGGMEDGVECGIEASDRRCCAFRFFGEVFACSGWESPEEAKKEK